jgi:pimeloyl-ACP methyl ester carboxylesterase
MKGFVSTLLLLLGVATAQASTPVKNIVLVHGAFADGSGWEGVYRILTKDGYTVTIAQPSNETLTGDVTAVQQVLAKQDGPVVLVGHSYGGVVITQAGNDPKVKALVYVAAFVPDVGESLQSLNETAAAAPPIVPPENGFAVLDRAKFPAAFAADVDRDKAEFMAASQVPLGIPAFISKVTVAAWKTRPSYYIVSGDDHMIPPAAERAMAAKAKAVQVFEIKGGSHAAFVAQPDKVAKVIEQAATE